MNHDDIATEMREELLREAQLEQAPLFERLEALPHQFDFFQALRRIQAWAALQGFPAIGCSRSPAGDPIHLAQRPFLEFAPRTIDLFSSAPVPECRFPRPIMAVYFFGLFCPNGPLPLHLTEFALQRQREGDFTFTNFANVFHHRFLCFFYRAWACTRIAADLDSPARQRFCCFIGSLFGCADPPMQNRTPAFRLGFRPILQSKTGKPKIPGSQAIPERAQSPRDPLGPVPPISEGAHNKLVSFPPVLSQPEFLDNANTAADWPKLFFAGRLACQTRNAEGLKCIIEDYFRLQTRIETFYGRWIPVPAGSHCRLGQRPETASLGRSAIVGQRLWDCQTSFRIQLGPMTLSELERMLPGRAGFERLKQWVFEYTGGELAWDAQLLLKREEVPAIGLGKAGQSFSKELVGKDGSRTILTARACQLGWTIFLKTQPFARDADNLVLDPERP